MDKLLKEVSESINKSTAFSEMLFKIYALERKRKRLLSDFNSTNNSSEKLYLEKLRTEIQDEISEISEEVNSFWDRYKFNKLPF